MPGGRPSEYKEEYISKVDEYLASKLDTYEVLGEKNPVVKYKVQLPTIEGFARLLDVNKTTLYEWESNHPEFSNALDKIRTEQQERLINQGLAGNYSPTIAKLILSANHGMREKTETDITTKGESIKIDASEAIKIAKEYEERLKKGL